MMKICNNCIQVIKTGSYDGIDEFEAGLVKSGLAKLNMERYAVGEFLGTSISPCNVCWNPRGYRSELVERNTS